MRIRAQIPNRLPAPGIEVFLDLLVDEMVEVELEDVAESDKLICLHLSVSVKGLPEGLFLMPARLASSVMSWPHCERTSSILIDISSISSILVYLTHPSHKSNRYIY